MHRKKNHVGLDFCRQRNCIGKDHNFDTIKSYDDFKNCVKINDYEAFRPYIDRIVQGESNVLWKGVPKYFAKTSGTTSGAKYIPLTKESIPNHFGTARNALFNYLTKSGKADFMSGKMIFLSGSPELTKTGDILTGRLSGIVNHQVPGWLRTNQLPSYDTNCIEEWEEKLDKIVEETVDQDMRLISGIPPWHKCIMNAYLSARENRLSWKSFLIYLCSFMEVESFEPYRAKLEVIGKRLLVLRLIQHLKDLSHFKIVKMIMVYF